MTETRDDPSVLERRKVDHLHLCNEANVEARTRATLFDQVQLLHHSLPELAWDDVDPSTTLCGATLRSPLMVSGMTGGAAEARDINRRLAALAQANGMAFGLGSQRAMMRAPELASTYAVRDVAPDVFICGNIGGVQAAESSTQALEDLAGAIDANALCVHLNPAQELIQDHGDRDFRGVQEAVARLCEELSIPVIAKETGCGMGPAALAMLKRSGVATVDVSGVGGTTWVGVEALRGDASAASLGDLLWDWGIPSAVAVAYAQRQGFESIASGGIRSGLDAARAIALGANVASSALPFLRAAMSDDPHAPQRIVDQWHRALRSVMLLTGSRTLTELRSAPRILGPELQRWLDAEAVS